jgi:hypothetical protein
LNLTANVTLRKIHEELKQKAAQAEAGALPAACAGTRRPVHVNSPGVAHWHSSRRRASACCCGDGRHGGPATLPDGLDLSRHGG